MKINLRTDKQVQLNKCEDMQLVGYIQLKDARPEYDCFDDLEAPWPAQGVRMI